MTELERSLLTAMVGLRVRLTLDGRVKDTLETTFMELDGNMGYFSYNDTSWFPLDMAFGDINIEPLDEQ